MSIFTLQHSINFARPFIQYAPVTAGLGMEPAVSIGSMIKNSILNPPMTYNFNRAETTFTTTKNVQDYTETLTDLWFIEKVTLVDDAGKTYEIKDVYNNAPLSVSTESQRPSGLATLTVSGTSYKFRFIGVPNQIYTVTITYQKLAPQMGPFFITSVAAAVAGNTAYAGSFDTASFSTGSTAVITGLVSSVNNGSFVVVSCTASVLTVANASGVLATTASGYVSNLSWSPIPDYYSDVYNNLFLAELLALSDDARSQLYRQRGVAAMLAKDSGLTETQKNIFMQQWLARTVTLSGTAGMAQLGNSSRGQ